MLQLRRSILTSFLMMQSCSHPLFDCRRGLGRGNPRRYLPGSDPCHPAAFSMPMTRKPDRPMPGEDISAGLCQQYHSNLLFARGRGVDVAGGIRMLTDGRDRGQQGRSRRDIRLFIEGGHLDLGVRIDFSEGQSHYLRKVMRVAEGSEVKVFDGATGEWWCQIDTFGKKTARGLSCFAVIEMHNPESLSHRHAWQAPSWSIAGQWCRSQTCGWSSQR